MLTGMFESQQFSKYRTLYSVVVITIFSCHPIASVIGEDLKKPECINVKLLNVSQDNQRRNQAFAAGVQFVNYCNQCIAISFTLNETNDQKKTNSGCLVPAATKVEYRQTAQYSLKSYMDCDLALKNGLAPMVTATQLQSNFQTRRCAVVGDFAD